MRRVKRNEFVLLTVPALITVFLFNCLVTVPVFAGTADKDHLRKGSAASTGGEEIKDALKGSRGDGSGDDKDGGSAWFDTSGKEYYTRITKAIGNKADEGDVQAAVNQLLQQDVAYFAATGGAAFEAFLQEAQEILNAAEREGTKIRTQPLVVSTDLFTAASQPGYLTGIALIRKYLGGRVNIVALGKGNKIVTNLYAGQPAVIDFWVNKALFSRTVNEDGAYHGASIILADGEVPDPDLQEAGSTPDRSDWEIRLFSANTGFSWAVLGSALSEAFPDMLREPWAEYWNQVPGAGRQVTSRNAEGLFKFETAPVLSEEARLAAGAFREAAFNIFSAADFAAITGAGVDTGSLISLAGERDLMFRETLKRQFRDEVLEGLKAGEDLESAVMNAPLKGMEGDESRTQRLGEEFKHFVLENLEAGNDIELAIMKAHLKMLLTPREDLEPTRNAEVEAEKIVTAAGNLRKQDSILFQRDLGGAQFDAFLASAAAELAAAERDGKEVRTQTIAVSSALFNRYQQGYMTPLALVKKHLGKKVNIVVFGPGAGTIKAVLGGTVDAVENSSAFLDNVDSYNNAMVILAKGETADVRLHSAARAGKLKLMAANTYLSSVVIGNAVAKLFPGIVMEVWKQFFVSIREAGVITEGAYKAGYDDIVKHTSWENVAKIDDVFQFNEDMDMSVASKVSESAQVYEETSRKVGIGV